jgi:hypothetical protein
VTPRVALGAAIAVLRRTCRRGLSSVTSCAVALRDACFQVSQFTAAIAERRVHAGQQRPEALVRHYVTLDLQGQLPDGITIVHEPA